MAKLVLELELEPEVIKNAEHYATDEHTNIKMLVADYLKSIGQKKAEIDPLEEAIKNMVVPEDLKSLTGILKGAYPDDMDYKDMKYEYLKEKYDL